MLWSIERMCNAPKEVSIVNKVEGAGVNRCCSWAIVVTDCMVFRSESMETVFLLYQNGGASEERMMAASTQCSDVTICSHISRFIIVLRPAMVMVHMWGMGEVRTAMAQYGF